MESGFKVVGNTTNATNLLLNCNIIRLTADAVNDLGVIVDSRLTFNAHIQQIVAKAYIRELTLYIVLYIM